MSRIWNALQKVQQTAERTLRASDPCTSPIFEAADDPLLRPEPILSVPPDDHFSSDPEGTQITIPEVRAQILERIIYHTSPDDPGTDRFRLLRMRLRTLWMTGKLRTLLITSALTQDGKTTIALNLATALADQGAKRVLLIDADLHRGSVEQQLGLSPHTGLAECLQDSLSPHRTLQRVEPLGWYLLSAGKRNTPNPSELLRPQDFGALLHTLIPHFDWIVLDSPPVLALTDSLALAQAVDGILMVARAGHTPTKAIDNAIDLLGRKHILGLVLNGVDASHLPYSSYEKCYRKSKSDSDKRLLTNENSAFARS